jgi:glutamate-5-semialdehyde dehydrogenase
MMSIRDAALAAKEASVRLATLGQTQKNDVLCAMASALEENTSFILEKNALDIETARGNGMEQSMLDRLLLNERRIADMANGLRDVAQLNDPIGETLEMWRRPNGLNIGRVRVPLGVVAIIYEARPNVTADAIGLCIKTSNAVVLRGGSDAIQSNMAIADVMQKAAYANGLPEGAIQLIRDTDRSSAQELMRLNGIIDVLIPRGGAGLIQNVIQNATVPIIETGTGNCHVYVDAFADHAMAQAIVINAKTSRPSVCNAAESLLVHRDIAQAFLPGCVKALQQAGVQVRGCVQTLALCPDVLPADEQDYFEEFLRLTIAVKVVDSLDAAIQHINRYGTHHSDAIVTNDYAASQQFLQRVDSAAVYVNTSTRFTDGFEFGFGAEIGISTQKLHARGPMGLHALTTQKYIVYGDGQIR